MRPTRVVLGGALAVATIATAVFAALYFTKAPASSAMEQCGDRIFGRISSLTRKGDDYEMRFDPSLITSGLTANTAAAEDGVVGPGEPVPNDNYEIDEGQRLLTYLVPQGTPVTVLTNEARESCPLPSPCPT